MRTFGIFLPVLQSHLFYLGLLGIRGRQYLLEAQTVPTEVCRVSINVLNRFTKQSIIPGGTPVCQRDVGGGESPRSPLIATQQVLNFFCYGLSLSNLEVDKVFMYTSNVYLNWLNLGLLKMSTSLILLADLSARLGHNKFGAHY